MCSGVCRGGQPPLLLSRDSAGGPGPRRGSLSEWVSGLHPECREEGSRVAQRHGLAGALRPPTLVSPSTCRQDKHSGAAGFGRRLQVHPRGSCCPCQPPSPELALESGWVSLALEEGRPLPAGFSVVVHTLLAFGEVSHGGQLRWTSLIRILKPLLSPIKWTPRGSLCCAHGPGV